MNLKDRIKDLCEEKGISVSKLERDCGFANGYISKLDKSTPNTKKIQIIANYFEVPVQYLLTGKRTEEDVFYRIAMNKMLMEMYNALDHGRKKQVDRFIEILYLEMQKEKESPTVSQMTS